MNDRHSSQRLIYAVFTAVLLLFLRPAISTAASVVGKGMIQARLSTGLIEGTPLFWSQDTVQVLARDGALVTFRTNSAQDIRESSPRFFSYTVSEMRARMQQEFGRDFEVTPSNHYVVVHPKGKAAKWGGKFEELYRSFVHYFRVRGFQLQEPQFPLVAIVFPDRSAYQRYSAELGMQVLPGYLGHYSPKTNRVYLFDSSAISRDAWSQDAATIIHEATHQTAFNTGIHGRFRAVPRWVTEGLAMMFEAPGVHSSLSFQTQAHRINRERLADFHHYGKNRKPGRLRKFIATDQLFSLKAPAAYAEAWALSFYLCETRSRDYSRYLALSGSRDQVQGATPEQRLADFQSVFGNNLKVLEAQFVAYLDQLR